MADIQASTSRSTPRTLTADIATLATGTFILLAICQNVPNAFPETCEMTTGHLATFLEWANKYGVFEAGQSSYHQRLRDKIVQTRDANYRAKNPFEILRQIYRAQVPEGQSESEWVKAQATEMENKTKRSLTELCEKVLDVLGMRSSISDTEAANLESMNLSQLVAFALSVVNSSSSTVDQARCLEHLNENISLLKKLVRSTLWMD